MERIGNWVFGLFVNVSNTNSALDALEKSQPPVLYSAIKAELVVSKLQLAAALYRLESAIATTGLRTRNKGTELLLLLSPFRNVTEALSIFGAEGNGAGTLLIGMCDPQPSDLARLTSAIHGDVLPLERLSSIHCAERVMKAYGTHGGGSWIVRAGDCSSQPHRDV